MTYPLCSTGDVFALSVKFFQVLAVRPVGEKKFQFALGSAATPSFLKQTVSETAVQLSAGKNIG